jgi:cell division protein FtsW (lipid II flippase)
MGKTVLWLGLILLVLGGILIFISGTQNAQMQPTYPALFSNQIIWNWLAVIGLVILVVGIILRLAKK